MSRQSYCRRYRAVMLLALTVAVTTGCELRPLEVPAPDRPDHWHVSSGALRAADGRALIMRGANIANAHKSSPYFGFHEQQDFARMRSDWGMNAVRLLILWAAIEPQDGVYDDSYLDEVQVRLDWASQAGLHVVLDMHQDLYGEGFGGDGAPKWTCDSAYYDAYEPISPWFLNYLNENITACVDGFWNSESLQAHYAEAWRRVAARFAAHEAVVGFDVMNEPYWGSTQMAIFEDEKLKPFYERVVGAVRSEAPTWVAFLEPSASRNVGLPTGLTPFSFANVVYAPHSYDRDAESGNGFDEAKRKLLVAEVGELKVEATALGAALWIGEYGGNVDAPGIEAYMGAQYEGIGAAAGSSMYWAYDRDDGYGLLRPDGSEKTELLDLLVRPYPEWVAGDPISYAFDESSGAFSFSWRPDGTIVAPTEIVVPTRVYPKGYAVVCDDCSIEQQTDRLIVNTTSSAQQLTLQLTAVP